MSGSTVDWLVAPIADLFVCRLILLCMFHCFWCPIWSAERWRLFGLNLTSTLHIISNLSRSSMCNSWNHLVLFLILPLWAFRKIRFTTWLATRWMHDVTPVVLTFSSQSSACCRDFYRREPWRRFAFKDLCKRWGNSFTALDRICFSPCSFVVSIIHWITSAFCAIAQTCYGFFFIDQNGQDMFGFGWMSCSCAETVGVVPLDATSAMLLGHARRSSATFASCLSRSLTRHMHETNGDPDNMTRQTKVKNGVWNGVR